jgi:hypothetical protein
MFMGKLLEMAVTQHSSPLAVSGLAPATAGGGKPILGKHVLDDCNNDHHHHASDAATGHVTHHATVAPAIHRAPMI